MRPKEKLLELVNLRTSFEVPEGTVRAVEGVSLDIYKGETLALVGESGCGKSISSLSIIRLLPKNAKSDADKMLFRGQDLLALDKEGMRRVRGAQIATIFQEPMTSLDPVYRIQRQIGEVLKTHSPAMKAQEIYERSIEMLRHVGIPDPEQKILNYPHQLSGGLRQRAMIAIALIAEPSLLIADEPTTALDVTIQAQILSLLKDIQEESQMSILLITHDFAVVHQIAHRVAVMYAGKIVEEGTREAIFGEPKHPYTKALIHSIPGIKIKRGNRLASIPGTVPNPLRFPPACRFHPRCAQAREICRLQAPRTLVLEDRRIACHLYDDQLPHNSVAPNRQESDL